VTLEELYSFFRLELDKTNNGAVVSFENEELNYWLNAAVMRYINTRYTGNNQSGDGFEQTQKRIDDLIGLIASRTYDYTSVDAGYKITRINDSNIYQIDELPTNYMHSVGESVVIFDASTSGNLKCWKGDMEATIGDDYGERKISSVPISPISKKILNYKQELLNSLSDFNYNNGTASPICVWHGPSTANPVKFYTDGNYGIYKYTLEYIKKPTIIKAGWDEDGEFPEYAWMEIIKLAVMLALENISDQRAQAAAYDIATME
jgi:hypothetical protein